MRQLSYKQRLALAVNRIPKTAMYPYGKSLVHEHAGDFATLVMISLACTKSKFEPIGEATVSYPYGKLKMYQALHGSKNK